MNGDVIDRDLRTARAFGNRHIARAPATEGVVRLRRRQRQRFLEARVGNAVLLVLGRSGCVEQRALPIPAPHVAAQARERAGGEVLHFRASRTCIDGAIRRRARQRTQHEIEPARRRVGDGDAIGRPDRAERVVVVAGRDHDRRGAKHGGCFAIAQRVREIDPALGEEFQPAVELVIEEREQVVAINAVGHRRRFVRVVSRALRTRGGRRKAGGARKGRGTSANRCGPEVELPGGVRDGRAVDRYRAARNILVENTPGRCDRRIVETGGRIGIRRPIRRQPRTLIRIRREIAIRRKHWIAGQERAQQ